MRRTRLAMLATLAALVASTLALAGVAGAQQGPHEGDVGTEVVGGSAVPDGKYPFMASLQYDREGTLPRRDHFCGGTLISPFHVLTAAHCAEMVQEGPAQDPEQFVVPLEDFRVVVGGTTLNGDDGQVRTISDMSRIFIHPRWGEADLFAHDVAVLELDRPVRGIAPIRLATTGTDALERPGRLATVTGWGNTIAQPVGPGPSLGLFDGPNRMREARVPIVSDDECEAVYGDDLSPRLAVCAGRTNLDTCQGDSGGPLFVAVGSGFRQIGITSFGFGCGEIGFPGVYTQVSALPIGNFIQRVTGGVPVPAG
jgi:secreted trypsin-like serine protease